MKIESLKLIDELEKQTLENIVFGEFLKSLSDKILNKRIQENSWSTLECIVHLNLYGDYYLKEISEKINTSTIHSSTYFNSGILGNYFAQSMLPKEKMNRIKTFKSMDPIYSELDRNVIDIFIKQQYSLLELLELSKSKNLTKIKISISISKWIKIRLGDTFRFVINHNIRHIHQIKNILNS